MEMRNPFKKGNYDEIDEDDFQQEEHEDGNEEFYYDEESGLYTSSLTGKEYTANDLRKKGYDVDDEDDEDDEDSNDDEDDDTLIDDGDEEDLREYIDEEDEELSDEEALENMNAYYDEYDREQKENTKPNNLLKAFAVMSFILLLVAITYYFIPKQTIDVSDNTALSLQRAEEIINLMYINKDVDELINKNDTILEYFDVNLQSDLDLRDGDIYNARYSEFSNSPTVVDIEYLVEDTSGGILMKYTVSNEVDLPSNRIANFKFDEKGLISEFIEERLYPVINR